MLGSCEETPSCVGVLLRSTVLTTDLGCPMIRGTTKSCGEVFRTFWAIVGHPLLLSTQQRMNRTRETQSFNAFASVSRLCR
jgi:hypothetical protein